MDSRHLCRAKRTDNGEWVEGYLYRLSERLNPFIMLVNRGGEAYEVDPSTICQCTGVPASEGIIWENQILREMMPCGEPEKNLYRYYRVQYNAEYGCWEAVELQSGEVFELKGLDNPQNVGNVFDNPELLEVGE